MREQCKHGHSMTPENRYVYRGKIRCVTCRRAAKVRYAKANLHPLLSGIRWPKKTHCINGHKLTSENAVQKFHPKGWKDGRKCRLCENARTRVWVGNNPEYMYRSRIESQMRIRYGINSIEERDAILASQGNACAICRRTDCTWGKGFKDVWHIDHDPLKPGTYRGILCAFCNTALGRLEKFLPAVTEYLRGTGAALLPRNMDALSGENDVEVPT